MSRLIDETGNRHGKLLVIEKAGRKGHKVYWHCRCDCGNYSEVTGYRLRSGITKSCGCGMGYSLPPGEAMFNKTIDLYRRQAKRRGLVFEIEPDEFRSLTSSVCYYCGAEPANCQHPKDRNGEYRYSGLDRIDSNGGYILSNVVPCCRRCNIAKHTMTQQEFFDWARIVARRADGVATSQGL